MCLQNSKLRAEMQICLSSDPKLRNLMNLITVIYSIVEIKFPEVCFVWAINPILLVKPTNSL